MSLVGSVAHSMAADAGMMEGQPCMFPGKAIQTLFSVLESRIVLARRLPIDSSVYLHAGTFQLLNSRHSPHGMLRAAISLYRCLHIYILMLCVYIDVMYTKPSRLVGGGFHLMTFFGGAFTLIDSELGHNFDDLTDINTFQTFAFGQLGPRQFHIMDEWAKEVSSARMPFMEKILTSTAGERKSGTSKLASSFVITCARSECQETGYQDYLLGKIVSGLNAANRALTRATCVRSNMHPDQLHEAEYT